MDIRGLLKVWRTAFVPAAHHENPAGSPFDERDPGIKPPSRSSLLPSIRYKSDLSVGEMLDEDRGD